MNYYSPDTNKQGKTIAAIVTVLYMAVWLLLFFVVKIGIPQEKKPAYDGILVDFGTTAEGMGDVKPYLSDARTSAPQPARPGARQQVQTQNVEQAPAVIQTPERAADNAAQNAQAQETVEQQAEVNRRALFPGRNPDPASQSSTGYGTGNAPGNQGNPAGDHGGVSGGTSSTAGTGTDGHTFELSGRRLAGSFPVPAHPGKNKSGRVMVEITVDSQGNVVTARQLAHGSTTQDPELAAAAIDAAKKVKFTPDSDNPVQTGTITYIFKLD